MHSCFLLLGSNLGNKQDFIVGALQEIESDIGEIEISSGMYATEPWGFESNEEFVNMVIRVKTKLSANDVLRQIHTIENNFGRTRHSKTGYSSRKLDIDILFYDQVIMETESLEIPHPRLHKRRFALEPMLEIAPVMVHPKLNKTIEELHRECQDKLYVHKMV